MRLVFTLAALLVAGSAAAAPPAGKRAAQVGPGTGTGTTRCGPSVKYPDTGVLAPGTRVVVVEEKDGWVAVDAAGLGLLSWVRYVHVFDPDRPPTSFPHDAVVDPDGSVDIDVRAGLVGTNTPLDVRQVTVPRGTALRLLGPHVEHNGVKWFPVDPPAGDRRYLPASAVQWREAAAPTFTVKSPAQAGPPAPNTPPGPETSPAAPAAHPAADPSDHRLWAEAERAAAARDTQRAVQLYLEVGKDMNLQNRPEAAALCFKRVHEAQSDDKAPREPAAVARWHGPGTLRLTGVRHEGRATYAVSQSNGRGTACYVIAAPGVDLERFRDYAVDLYGVATTPPELNGVPLVTATRVQQARR